MRSCSRRSAEGRCATLEGNPRQPSCAITSLGSTASSAAARRSSSGWVLDGRTESFGGTMGVLVFFCSGLAPTPQGSSHALPLRPVFALAHIDGGKGLRLREFQEPITRHLQRGSERACQRRARDVRCGAVLLEEHVELHPAGVALADQRLQAVARLFDRPHDAAGNDVHTLDGALALLRIGFEQIVNRRRELAHPDGAHALGHAAREHVAPQALAGHQRGGGATHGLQPLQAEGKPRRQLLAAWLVIASALAWQQQPAFQVCEPCRHHQVVGGELKPQLLRLRNEQQILLCQCQHGDFGKIDLLRARQYQEHIERPLEAIEGDDQGLLFPRPLLGGFPNRKIGLGHVLGGVRVVGPVHGAAPVDKLLIIARETTLIQASARKTSATQASAAATSNACGGAMAAQARSNLARDCPVSAGTTAATASVAEISPAHSSAKSDPARSAACARSGMLPASAAMPRSSLSKRPSKPIKPRITSRVTRSEMLAGAAGSMAANTTWAVIAAGKSASARKGKKSEVSSSARPAGTLGNSRWLSLVARP